MQYYQASGNSRELVVIVSEIKELLDRYSKWLSARISIRQFDEWVEITTPYLDRHNDYLQIYAKKKNGQIILSDDGYIIQDLIQSGFSLKSSKRKSLLNTTLNGFGISLKDNTLTVTANKNNFASKKHNLIQSMLAVNDLFYLSEPFVESFFFEDVKTWMDENEIRYIQNVKFTGATGYDHVFQFAIPKSKSMPERILRAINTPRRDTAESFAWAWVDTRKIRPPDSIAYAILNDIDKPLPDDMTEALLSYDINPAPWSQRDRYREKLAA